MQTAFLIPSSLPCTNLKPTCQRSHPKCLNLQPILPIAAASILLTNPPLVTNIHNAFPLPSPVQAETSLYFPVQDPARILTTGQASRLSERLKTLYSETGLRLQIVTRGPELSTLPSTDPRTIIIAIDPRAGNILSFSVGSAISTRFPPAFFIEATNRFGNAFYIRDNGADTAVFSVVSAIEQCARSGKVCRTVPGISEDQWKISVVSASIAGCIAGAAARTGGEKFNARFLILFSPLWGIFLVSFGLGPILTRGGVGLELLSTAAAFIILGAGVWGWIPRQFGPPGSDAER